MIEQLVAAIGAPAMSLLFEWIAHPGHPVRKVTLSGRAMLRG
ncbi:LacI family transcriptional regulator [Methylorubrum extorquens]|nr:LacI family fructose operon transcriptional repressor [Methylorubrum extorquens]